MRPSRGLRPGWASWTRQPPTTPKPSNRLKVPGGSGPNRASAYLSLGHGRSRCRLLIVSSNWSRRTERASKLANCHSQLGRYQDASTATVNSSNASLRSAQPHADLAWLLATCPDAKFRDARSPWKSPGKRSSSLPNSRFHGRCWAGPITGGAWKASIEAFEKSIELQKDGGDTGQWFILGHGSLATGPEGRSRASGSTGP